MLHGLNGEWCTWACSETSVMVAYSSVVQNLMSVVIVNMQKHCTQLNIVACSVFHECCILSVVHCLHIDYHSGTTFNMCGVFISVRVRLCVACCVLHVVCCMLCVACCVLRVVCCVL